LRAAQHFDAIDIADEQIAEVEAATGRGRIIDLDAIDQRHRLIGFGAADEDAIWCRRCRRCGW
jgi:hypothetical protein